MISEQFVSDSLSRKQFQEILDQFLISSEKLGADRNSIKIVHYGNEKLVVKSFKVPNRINQFAYKFLRKSKAERSYRNAFKLLDNGIGTAHPLGYLEMYKGPRLFNSYYVCKHYSHDFTLREVVRDEVEERVKVLRAYTDFIHKMHESQVLFLDNSPGNTLISRHKNSLNFALVDLNRMKFRELDYNDRIANFARVAPSRDVYEIIGTRYAELIEESAAKVVSDMWRLASAFQAKYHSRRNRKKKFKKIFKGKK